MPLLLLLLLVTVVQLAFWGYFLQKAYDVPLASEKSSAPYPPVSIIVCFHNEATLVAECVQQILRQTYAGEFELLLVNDNSTDDSAAVVRPFGLTDQRVRLLEPGATRSGKKDALTYGIKQARFNFLLLTDADCVPASETWLTRMVTPLKNGAEVALGVSPFFSRQDHAILGNWQRFEAAYTSLKYLGFARRGLPYMGVGRNLAYRRSFFQGAGGFAAHAELPSGDDDLLIGAAAKFVPIARVTHPAAWVYTHSQSSWSGYFRQRSRHQSTGSYYRKEYQLLLGGLALSHGLFFLLGVYLLFTAYWWVALLAYLLRWPLVVRAFLSSFLAEMPVVHLGAAAGTKAPFRANGPVPQGNSLKRKVSVAIFVTIFDAWIGPMYLFLAVSTLRTQKEAW
ncbi:MAG: glycosyltransferase [Bacteroidota bacterium]